MPALQMKLVPLRRHLHESFAASWRSESNWSPGCQRATLYATAH